MSHCSRCGHHSATRSAEPRREGEPTLPLYELMRPPRLVDLLARRPDLASRALLGARIAAGTLENA